MASDVVSSLNPLSFTPGTIPRPRVLDILRPALRRKLTLIKAATGYGKTVAAMELARHSPIPTVWQTLNALDRDALHLSECTRLALEAVVPGLASPESADIRSPEELALLLAEQLEGASPFLYVIDDVHVIERAPTAERWLRTFVASMPASCHLVLVSRTLPNLPYAEMVARRQVLAIGPVELRFTPEEVIELALQMRQEGPSQREMDFVTAQLEGWAAGTVLAFQPLPAGLGEVMLAGDGGPEALFQELASSMLRTQPPGLRDFLLSSSTLSKLTPSLCSSALRLSGGRERLEEVQRRNLFVSRVPGGLVYHALFRSFLQRQLKTYDPDRYAQLHAQAGTWFERADDFHQAIDHYVAASRIADAARVAEHAAPMYFANGRHETLLGWAKTLAHTDGESPEVFYRSGIILTYRYDYEGAVANLDKAETSYVERGDVDGIGAVLYQRAIIAYQEADYAECAGLGERLLAFVPLLDKVRGRGLRMRGKARVRLGQLSAGLEDLKAALPLFRADGDVDVLANLLMDLDLAYTRLGRMDDAAAHLHEAVALRRSTGAAGPLALVLNNLGYHYHLRGEYALAHETLSESLSHASKASHRRAETHALWSLGDLQRDRRAFYEAEDYYERALSLLADNDEPSTRAGVLVATSTLRRWRRRLDSAVSLAQEAAGLANEHAIGQESLTAQVAFWAARAQMGEAKQAQSELAQLATSLDEEGSRHKALQALGLRALAALRANDEDDAHEALCAAANLAGEIGFSQPLVAELAHNPELEALVSAHPGRYGTLLEDLKCLREAQIPDEAGGRRRQAIVTNSTYDLQVFTLGREHVERDGQADGTTEWRTEATKAIFYQLLFNGPQTREELGVAFWPEANPDQARSNVNNAVYNCRRKLGDEVIKFRNNRHQIGDEITVWCDAQVMETYVAFARLLPSRDARTEELWRKAVELYRGVFLPSLDTDWADVRRSQLEAIHGEALVGLAVCAQARGDFKLALSALKQALDVSPYDEGVHQHLLSLYAAMNDKGHLVTHYEDMKKLFREDLSTEPSPTTAALFKSLLN